MCGWSPESSDQTKLSVNFNSSHTHTHCNNKIEFYVAITQQHFAKEIDSFVSLLASAFTTQQILNRTMFISRERIEFLVSACDIRVCVCEGLRKLRNTEFTKDSSCTPTAAHAAHHSLLEFFSSLFTS